MTSPDKTEATPDIVTRLAARGVMPEQALRDIERSPDYMKIIASDDGQDLLGELARQAVLARGLPSRDAEGGEYMPATVSAPTDD